MRRQLATTSDLGRIILASNYGIGLRTGAALETLRVSKIPANLRDRELNIGRGFIAKSGQITMLQVATPYQDEDVSETAQTSTEDADLVAAALDRWISEIRDKWQDQSAVTRLAPGANGAGGVIAAQPVESKQVLALKGLLQKALRWEVTTLKNGGEGDATLTMSWLDLSPTEQNQEGMLFRLCRAASSNGWPPTACLSRRALWTFSPMRKTWS
ncbi:MAG: hypothetical protein R3E79_04125 [Caldilineaceae bacterium]